MRRIAVILLSLALFAGPVAFAHEKGRLAHLRQYAGTDQGAEDPLFQDPEVKRLLSMALGDELQHFFDNISVKEPVDLISGALVVSGNGVHQGCSEEAIVAIHLNRGDLCAAMFSQGKVNLFGFGGAVAYPHLPKAIRAWIALRNAECAHIGKMPPNVTIIKPSIASLQNATIDDFTNAKGGGEDALMDFINAGMDVRLRNDEGTTPLHVASRNGYKALAELLVSKGADVNAVRSRGWTPLLDACSSHRGSKEMVEFLLSNGADIKAQSYDGQTALHLAVFESDLDVIQLLLARSANINARDARGRTPLALALERESHDIVESLKRRGGLK